MTGRILLIGISWAVWLAKPALAQHALSVSSFVTEAQTGECIIGAAVRTAQPGRGTTKSYLRYQQYSPFADSGQAFVIPTSHYSNVKGGGMASS